MNDNATIQAYINNLRRRLAGAVRPGMGISSRVLPSTSGGAVLEVCVGPNIKNQDVTDPVSESVNLALGKIQQKAFGGDLNGFRFAGTNYIIDGGRFVLIKGDDSEGEWSDAAAERDWSRLVAPRRQEMQ